MDVPYHLFSLAALQVESEKNAEKARDREERVTNVCSLRRGLAIVTTAKLTKDDATVANTLSFSLSLYAVRLADDEEGSTRLPTVARCSVSGTLPVLSVARSCRSPRSFLTITPTQPLDVNCWLFATHSTILTLTIHQQTITVTRTVALVDQFSRHFPTVQQAHIAALTSEARARQDNQLTKRRKVSTHSASSTRVWLALGHLAVPLRNGYVDDATAPLSLSPPPPDIAQPSSPSSPSPPPPLISLSLVRNSFVLVDSDDTIGVFCRPDDEATSAWTLAWSSSLADLLTTLPPQLTPPPSPPPIANGTIHAASLSPSGHRLFISTNAALLTVHATTGLPFSLALSPDSTKVNLHPDQHDATSDTSLIVCGALGDRDGCCTWVGSSSVSGRVVGREVSRLARGPQPQRPRSTLPAAPLFPCCVGLLCQDPPIMVVGTDDGWLGVWGDTVVAGWTNLPTLP
uniref:Uncharacterized protein n=1 Tax=Sexangularia sp. CB-2014 TaxID=1486929 RepID=A0A6U0J8T4_9EUKA